MKIELKATYARMLVRTQARIRILFEHGSCDVWVKECCLSYGKQNRTLESNEMQNREQNSMFGPSYTNKISVDVDVIPEHKRSKRDFGSEGAEEAEEDNNKSESTDVFEPLLTEMLNRPEEIDECVWYDPVIVNETSGWIMTMPDNEPRPHPLHSEEAVQLSVDAPDSSYQLKNTRGRPRKRNK